MNIKMTSIVALAMVLGLAACQEEESAEGTETEQSGEAAGESEDPETSGGQSDTQDVATEAASDGEPEASAAEVERETTETGEASQEATNSAVSAARDGDSPSTAAEEPATEAAAEDGVVGAEADDQSSLDDVLTPGSFDAERVVAAIDESDLDEARKEELRELARTVAEDPQQSEAAIETLRSELLPEDGADAGSVTGGDSDFAAGPGSVFTPESFGPREAPIDSARVADMRTTILHDPADTARLSAE